MKTYKILRPEGFKDCCFDGLTFPVTVQAVKIKSGMMKGWIEVNGSEFIKQGCTSWLTDDHMSFEFSPAAFIEV